MIIGMIVGLVAFAAWHRLKAHARAGTGPFRTPTPPVVVDCSALHRANAQDWAHVARHQDRQGLHAAAAASRACAVASDQLARGAHRG